MRLNNFNATRTEETSSLEGKPKPIFGFSIPIKMEALFTLQYTV